MSPLLAIGIFIVPVHGTRLAPGEVTAHITGTVTQNGTAISGVTVWAWSYTSGVEVSAVTDGNGAFDLGVAVGSWGVEVDADYALANNLLRNAQYATVTNGQMFSGVPLRLLETTAAITGTVIDPFEKPLGTAGNAYAWGEVNGEYYQSYSVVSADGTFSLPVIAGQAWGVGADGCASKSITPNGAEGVRLVRSPITVGPADQAVAPGQNAVFSVTVDAPSPTFQWQLLPSGGNGEWASLSDNTTCSGTKSAMLTVISPSIEDSLFRCQVDYSLGNSTTTDTSSAARLLVVTAHLRGQLTRSGTGLGNFTITATKQSQSGQTSTNAARTDGSGAFDIGVSGNGTWSLGIDFGEAMSAGIVPSQLGVEVANNQDVNDIAFPVIDVTGSISGNVIDAHGAPVAFADIWASALIAGQACSCWALTDGNGFYMLPIADGTWTVGTSSSYPSKTISVEGNATINFAPDLPPVIVSVNLASGSVGGYYTQVLSAEGGMPPYTWSLVAGALPEGMVFGKNGTITGTPSSAATEFITVRVTDSDNLSATADFLLRVTSPFAAWEEMNFSIDEITAGNTGPAADFDHDGIPNILEYALLRSVKLADGTGVTSDVLDGTFTISFSCDSNHTDITCTVQSSTDLGTWADIAESTGGGAFSATADTTVTDPGNGSGQRTVTVTANLPAGGRLFLRVKAAK